MRRMPTPRRLPGLLLALTAAVPLIAQNQGTDDDKAPRPSAIDPYTNGDAAPMAAAGIVAYGPLPWADFQRTTDIDKVVGEHRMRWIETAHFRIGSSLGATAVPVDAEKRKALHEEVRTLRKRLPKVPDRPKNLDPWLRLHLYAQRAERCYTDFLALIGRTDADFPARGNTPREGAYLGLPDKFLVLLFQRKSDMVRYVDRFCGRKEDSSLRFYHDKSHQMLVCMCAEGLEGFDEVALHGHLVYATTHCLLSGYNGFYYPLPLWFSEGIAHWYARQIPSDTLNVQILDDEAVAEDKQANWPVKVRRRAQHKGAFFPFATMATWTKWEELGYHAHSQSWSRVDFLMQQDVAKVGQMVRELKGLPAAYDHGERRAVEVADLAQKLLRELFGLDADAFDEKWREWVLRTYPRR